MTSPSKTGKYNPVFQYRPSPDDIRRTRESTGMMAGEAGYMVHCTPGQWEKFESGEAKIRMVTWELWLWKSGLVTLQNPRVAL